MSGMIVSQETGQIYPGGQSQKVAISGTSAQSTSLLCKSVVLCSDIDCFIRQGENPTALDDGTDQFLPAYNMVRYYNFHPGNKIAAIAATAGNLYITPEY
jgi:hypothetical protein